MTEIQEGIQGKRFTHKSGAVLDVYPSTEGDNEIPILVVNGFAVRPPKRPDGLFGMSKDEHFVLGYNSNGAFELGNLEEEPEVLGRRRKVIVGYQPGAQGKPFTKGFYGGLETELVPYQAAVDLFGEVYPVAHSLASRTQLQIVNNPDLGELKGRVKPGAIVGAIDDARDAVSDEEGRQRKIWGAPFLPALTIYKLAGKLGMPKWLQLPVYVLGGRSGTLLHNEPGDTHVEEGWKVPSMMATSPDPVSYEGNVAYARNMRELAPQERPLIGITSLDQICTPERQRELARTVRATRVVELESGHNLFKNRAAVEKLRKEINADIYEKAA